MNEEKIQASAEGDAVKAMRTALDFAAGAIGDAIHTEDGLDGDAGQRVLHIITEARELGTFDQQQFGALDHLCPFTRAEKAEAALSAVQPKGTELASGDSTLTDLEHDLRHLHGVYSDDGGARRITPEGLRQSVEANRFSKPYWFASSTHKLPAGTRAYCSCCAKPQSEVLHWNLLALCRECVAASFPEGPTPATQAPAPAQAMPAGCKLVPIEPTPEMVEAWNKSGADDFKIPDRGCSDFTEELWQLWKLHNARKDWRAMLDAAPVQAPAVVADDFEQERWRDQVMDLVDAFGDESAIKAYHGELHCRRTPQVLRALILAELSKPPVQPKGNTHD